MEIIDQTDGWVSLFFQDGSIQTIHTSLAMDCLKKHGAKAQEGRLFDLDKSEYLPFRYDAVSVQITRDKPKRDSEVLQFADRFI